MSAIKTDTRLCKMYKEGERLNACCIQSKVAKTTITGKLVTILYNFWCSIPFTVTQTGPQSLIRINATPQSFLFSWEVSLALILVPTLPGVFLAFHHWSLPPVIKSASFHLLMGGGHCIFASPCCYFHPPLCFLPSFPCLTSGSSSIYQLHLP